MITWDALYVNELSHCFSNYIETTNSVTLVNMLRAGLVSNSRFEQAFSAGLITWLSKDYFDMTDEIPDGIKLDTIINPPLYDHPSMATQREELLNKALPEFLEYGIAIKYFDKKEI